MATSESEVLEETYDLSRSPVFTASDMEKLRTKDKKEGVPLQTPWTFWIDKASNASSAAQYQANLKKIYSVSTVQDFWAVLKHIPSVEALPPTVWQELLLAAIGEQLSEGLCEGDSICGVTVAVREKDDLVQVCVIISLRLNITRLNIF
ncbi:eukaryotic translation initiation factor 4E type 3-like isoform X2 [Homalodisca vitripennis]|uniref:eukaryotic translation initiation factor 4E type 3-like isoform X2 n=1 Tax=Homalodisca vitripennis TaxID=197043 RepID=UPI001EE9EA75|nr:eukaryotic translation initiation factor 4E type 3-like isoform X2 [Homalodisca vitripennis]